MLGLLRDSLQLAIFCAGELLSAFTTANIFPMASGIPGWSYGAVEAVLQAGAKKVAFLDSTTDAAESFAQSSDRATEVCSPVFIFFKATV